MSTFKLLELLPGTLVRSSEHGRLGVVMLCPSDCPTTPGICWVEWLTKGAELLTDAALAAWPVDDDADPEPVRLCDVVLTGHVVTGVRAAAPPRRLPRSVVACIAVALAQAWEERGQTAEREPYLNILEHINKMFEALQLEQPAAQPESATTSQPESVPAEPPTPLPVCHVLTHRRGVYEFDGIKHDGTVRVRWADNQTATARVHVTELCVPEAKYQRLDLYLSDARRQAPSDAPQVTARTHKFRNMSELFAFLAAESQDDS